MCRMDAGRHRACESTAAELSNRIGGEADDNAFRVVEVQMLRRAGIAIMALASAHSAGAAETVPTSFAGRGQVSIANVDNIELERFLAASMVFAQPDRGRLVAYEMVTRCSIEIPTSAQGSVVGQPILRSLRRDYVSAVAPAIAMHTAIELTTMLAETIEPQQEHCTNRIRGYFGSQYAIDAAALRPLAQRAIAILKGESLDQGANRIEDATARNVTDSARVRVANQIMKPLFVGAIRAPGHVAVIVGEPGAVVRWVVQFAEMQGGGYAVEGGVEAGLIHESE